MAEGRKPALLDSFFQSLVLAPLFVWFELLFLLGYRRGLYHEIQASEGGGALFESGPDTLISAKGRGLLRLIATFCHCTGWLLGLSTPAAARSITLRLDRSVAGLDWKRVS